MILYLKREMSFKCCYKEIILRVEVGEKVGKLVIFVPHQDDETNLAGNILSYLVKQYDVYVVYSSLDAKS